MAIPKHIAQNSILYMDGVTVSFDGFKALNNLSLILQPGEMRAIIGPNGAGKTTMMDVITGKVKPQQGKVIFRDNVDLTQYDEAAIANMGIGRKFQKPTVIESLTVFENLELALKGNRRIWDALLHTLDRAKKKQIIEILDTIGLRTRQQELAGALSHGQKQWLEIGMLMIQGPEVLLIDEPAAGMTDAETMQTAELFKVIAKHHSLVVVEHDMEFVKALDCPVTVLHEGSVLAQGTLDQVQNNQQVIEVYLGR